MAKAAGTDPGILPLPRGGGAQRAIDETFQTNLSTGSGFYEVTIEPPQPGLYYVFVEVASAGLPLKNSPSELLQVKAPPASPVGAPSPAATGTSK